METVKESLVCIGVRNGKRCKNVSPQDPPYPNHPLWPYLCSECANEPARRGSRDSIGFYIEDQKVLDKARNLMPSSAGSEPVQAGAA